MWLCKSETIEDHVLYHATVVSRCTSKAMSLPAAVLRDVLCVLFFVCVFLPIHSGHQVRWTNQPGEEGHTGIFFHLPSAVRALIFLARSIQPFLSLVDREVEFCVLLVTI